MRPSILSKLNGELQRYQNKGFLKAAMAVCALTANADNEVNLSERYQIDEAISNEPALRQFNITKATNILDEYIWSLRHEDDAAKRILYNKIRRMAGDYKRSRTLMRVAYLVITADHDVKEEEMLEFQRICELLDLRSDEVWRDAAAKTGRTTQPGA